MLCWWNFLKSLILCDFQSQIKFLSLIPTVDFRFSASFLIIYLSMNQNHSTNPKSQSMKQCLQLCLVGGLLFYHNKIVHIILAWFTSARGVYHNQKLWAFPPFRSEDYLRKLDMQAELMKGQQWLKLWKLTIRMNPKTNEESGNVRNVRF